jgi:hypothetical protein
MPVASGRRAFSGGGNRVHDSEEPTESGETDVDGMAVSTLLVEVCPGIAAVFGEIPAELKTGRIEFDGGLLLPADRAQLSASLAAIGEAAGMVGSLGSAFAGAQGLYRMGDAGQALLRSGATLAAKDGGYLGTIITADGFRQARFFPVSGVSAAQTAAAIGPALAMVSLQMQLSEITGLVRTNIALTSEVLGTVRKGQWSELAGLVATFERTLGQARKTDAVTTSLWQDVAGSSAALDKQLDLYRRNVGDHAGRIDRSDPRRCREYLQTNAEAVFYDVHALLASVKAWTEYQALRAARARAAGRDDDAEARLSDVIVQDTRAALDSILAEARRLVDALARELHIIAELPGRDTLSQSLVGRRKDAKAVREASTRLLEAIDPLADMLRPPVPVLQAPEIVCAPSALDLEPYLRILRWFLEDGETLRVLGFPEQLDAPGPISALLGGAKEKLAAVLDKSVVRTLVAVTDRRALTAMTSAFLEHGEIRQELPIDRVRYVRAATARDRNERSAVDLVTRDETFRWLFRADVDAAQVDALAAVLAESMTIPDTEREALQRRRTAPEQLEAPARSSRLSEDITTL